MMRASWEEETSLLMQGTSPLAAGTAHHHHPTLLHGGEGDRYQQHVHQRSNNSNNTSNSNSSNNAMRTSNHNERTPLLVDGQATAQRINVSASHNNNNNNSNNNKSQDIYRRRRMTNQRSHQVMAHAYSVESSSVFEDQDLGGDNKDRYSSFATKHSRDDDDDEDDDQDEDGGQNDEDDDEVNVRFAKKHHLRHQGVVVDDDHDDDPEGQSMTASSGEDDDDDDDNNNNKHHDISAGPAARSNHNNNNNKHQSRKKSKSSASSSSWMHNCCWKGGWIKSCRRWYRRRQRSCSTHVFRTHCMICLWQMQTLFRRCMDCTYWIVHDMMWFIHPHDSRGDNDPVSSRSFSVYDANILGCDEDRFRGGSRGVDEIENLKYDDDDDDNEDLCSFSAWRCSFGTREQDGTWLNVSDRAGTLMALLVWVLILYSAVTMYLLAQDGYLPVSVAVLYMTLAAAALACHAKTAFTDPGSIPSSAAPPRHVTATTISSQSSQNLIQYHAVCAACHTYKPPGAHHCRVCNRCIHRMDHHCPWMNNCIGAGNIKFFLLFLFYTWTSCAVALTVFATNYFGCSVETCQYDGVHLHLVRLMTALCVATVLFTTNIGVNMIYAIMTGVGTIERFQHQQQNQLQDPSSTNNKDGIFQDNMIAVYEAIPFRDIFGAGPIWTWFVPMDPVFYQNNNHDDNDDDDDGGGSQSSSSRLGRRRHSHQESDDLERVLGYRLLPGGIQLRDRIQILQMPLSTGGGSVSITTQSLFSPMRNHRMVTNNNNSSSSKSRSLGTTMTGIQDRRHQQLLQHRSDDDDDALWLQQQRQESRRIPVTTTTTVNQDDYDI